MSDPFWRGDPPDREWFSPAEIQAEADANEEPWILCADGLLEYDDNQGRYVEPPWGDEA